MFDKASRLKLRFDTVQGQLAVEDLWSLPLTTTSANKACLDHIAIALFKQLKDASEISFVSTSTKPNEVNQLRFDIVKHIIDVRVAENAAAALVRANAEKKQQILEIIDRKQNEELANSSVEDLRKLAESL